MDVTTDTTEKQRILRDDHFSLKIKFHNSFRSQAFLLNLISIEYFGGTQVKIQSNSGTRLFIVALFVIAKCSSWAWFSTLGSTHTGERPGDATHRYQGSPGVRCDLGYPEIQNSICDTFTFGEKERETWICAYEFAPICEKEDNPNTVGEGRDRVRRPTMGNWGFSEWNVPYSFCFRVM